MNRLKKLGVAAAVVAPFAFGVNTEAGAEQSPTPTIPTPSATDFAPETTVAVSQPVFEVPSQYWQDSSRYSEVDDAESDDRGLILVIGVGSLAAIGCAVVVYGIKRMDQQHNRLSQEDIDTLDHLEEDFFVAQHTTPIGPEDDPDFWPPVSR